MIKKNSPKYSLNELLQPRYKVISLYPNSEYPLGTIITIDIESAYVRYPDKKLQHTSSYEFLVRLKVGNHPTLFKKLKWWEERNIEEMPD